MIISLCAPRRGWFHELGSITITRKFHFFALPAPIKRACESQEVIIIRACGTELRAPEIILYSLHPPFFPFFFCLCIAFNLRSKQLWQGLWSFDERQKEAAREWVWGNEAAMSRSDLWAFPFRPLLPSQRRSQFKYRITEKFNSDHAQSDHCAISRGWIALFV